MRELLISVAVLPFALGVAIAQPTGTAGNPSLSLDQQSRISEIITNQTPQPLTGINFSIAPDVVVPPDVALQRLEVNVSGQAWHTLGIAARDDRLTVLFDGRELFVAIDRRFPAKLACGHRLTA